MGRVLYGAGIAAAAFSLLVSAAAAKEPSPRSLAAAERQTLDHIFGDARPVHTYLIPYAKKVWSCGCSTMSSLAVRAARPAMRLFRAEG